VLYRKINGFDIRTLLFETTKILVATFNTSVIVFFLLKLFDGLIFDTSRTINVFLLLVVCSIIYAILYLFLTWLFGIKEIYLLTKMLFKVRQYQKRVVEVYQGVE
jgi:putative peptidoglycan lipid II flippase